MRGWEWGLWPRVWVQQPGSQRAFQGGAQGSAPCCGTSLCLAAAPVHGSALCVLCASTESSLQMCRSLFSSARNEREFSGPGDDYSPPPSTQDTQLGHSTNGRRQEGLQGLQVWASILGTACPPNLHPLSQSRTHTHPMAGSL